MRFSLPVSALVASLVGFGSTLALIISAANALGASQAQTASMVTTMCLAIAVTSGFLSIHFRMPVITAWSTPGLAIIAGSSGIAFADAIGTFLLVAVLILFTSAFKPLGVLISKIPKSIASAMLAGVLLQFVMRVFTSLQTDGLFVGTLLLTYLIVWYFSVSGAVIAVLAVGLILIFGTPELVHLEPLAPIIFGEGFATLSITLPGFDLQVLLGLGIPLYLVTMASQNLPGFAVLQSNGYEPPTRPILFATGLASLFTAMFGAVTTNMAAITAAICMGKETHPDPDKRWISGAFYAVFYCVLAIFSTSLVVIFDVLPGSLVATVAGLALLGALTGALGTALANKDDHFVAVVTFAVTASGLQLFGIGSAFWGLIAGLIIYHLLKHKKT
ncbi:MAG: benzoate/H(+) symporter BenE family transporter [Cohaesibacteraceae bacterium]|nr:benzoate/H(+) symporter BenE family transporter [Cohaesibacteraceae bacterium]